MLNCIKYKLITWLIGKDSVMFNVRLRHVDEYTPLLYVPPNMHMHLVDIDSEGVAISPRYYD